MNIGMAKVFQTGVKQNKWLMVAFVQLRLSYFFVSSKEFQSYRVCCSGWCGKSHTLPYPGYATGTMDTCSLETTDAHRQRSLSVRSRSIINAPLNPSRTTLIMYLLFSGLVENDLKVVHLAGERQR